MTAPATRHVWVREDFRPVEQQGLLLRWEQDGRLWRGLVVTVDQHGTLLPPRWVPSDRIRPVHSTPNTGSMYDPPLGDSEGI